MADGRRRPWRRAARWVLPALAVCLGLVLADAWTALGHRATGERRTRVEHSPQWKGSKFDSPEPLINDAWGSVKAMFEVSPFVSPAAAAPIVPVTARPEGVPPTGLRVTWFGHSATLVEIDGKRLLTDPVWSDRASPLTWVGPHRWFPPPAALHDLQPIDAVLISHDHYDHLDYATVTALAKGTTLFVVPLGVGAHLAYWGIPEDRIIELDWWQATHVGEVEITCVPARHASGRHVLDLDATLWAGYALRGPTHRVYYSGDTGLFPAMKQIGQQLGPFDLTMIEVGQYHRAWPDWHIGPEQAVTAHQWVKGKVMLPVHWGLFPLAMHGWTEPIERALAEGQVQGQVLVAPRPGQAFEPGVPLPVERWWPEVTWTRGALDPIVSSQLGPVPALRSP